MRGVHKLLQPQRFRGIEKSRVTSTPPGPQRGNPMCIEGTYHLSPSFLRIGF